MTLEVVVFPSEAQLRAGQRVSRPGMVTHEVFWGMISSDITSTFPSNLTGQHDATHIFMWSIRHVLNLMGLSSFYREAGDNVSVRSSNRLADLVDHQPQCL